MRIEDITPADMANLNAQGYQESDLSMLAESEVKALLFTESTSEGLDPHEQAEQDQIDAEAASKEAAAGGEPASSVTSYAAEAEDDAPAASFVPQYTFDVPADAKEQIEALKVEERAAFKQLMDGTIEADAYQVIRDRTETAQDELKDKVMKASIFEQANVQASEQVARAEWNKAQAASMTAFKAEGIDYLAKPALLAALNVNLKALGADPKNERRDGAWFFTEAHRLTKDDLGFVTKKVVQVQRNGVDVGEMPPTLRNVPVASTGSVSADEFAHMRTLNGVALERAHAAMTPDQRDRWMAE